MTYDASDPRQVAAARKDAFALSKRLNNFLRNCMADSAGRDFFYDLLADCHVFQSPFIRGAPDATAFSLGEQNVGLRIMSQLIQADPSLYLQMLGEQNERDARNDSDRTGSGEEPAGDGSPAGGEGE